MSSALTVDEMQAALQRQYGFDATRARSMACAALGIEAMGGTSQLVADVKRADVLEKEEQRVIVCMARAIGFHVYSLSQARSSKQTPGLPDLWLAHPARGFAGWWEAKRPVGGKRSTVQSEFAAECDAARVVCGHGDRYAFARFLEQHGFTPPTIPT